jgi:ribosomal-protein-alanine N-acetyltransferase
MSEWSPRQEIITLRAAVKNDAPGIYFLMRGAFGANFLAFTIYRSEKTISYIANLIATKEQTFIIAERQGKIAGYANVAFNKQRAILNYIAVASSLRGSGYGSILLAATESEVRDRGFVSLELDVFESNKRVAEWYTKAGYESVSRSFLYRIDLAAVTRKSLQTEFNPALLQSALATEKQSGFSKAMVKTSSGEITLGIIDGNACKLIGYRGMSLDDAIAAAIGTVNGSRSELIVSSYEPPASGFQLLGLEISIRMVKMI